MDCNSVVGYNNLPKRKSLNKTIGSGGCNRS